VADKKVVDNLARLQDAGGRLRAAYNAQKQAQQGSVTMAGKEAAALKRLKDATGALEKAQINRTRAERNARAAMSSKGAMTAGTPANERMVAANERLRISQINLEKAERDLAAVQKASAQSKAAAAAAAENLRVKSDALAAAQRRVVAIETAIKAAAAESAAAQTAQAAAAQRLALAETEVAAAEARVVAANNAVTASTARATAAQNAGTASSQRYGRALGNDIDKGAKRANKSVFDLASRTQWLGRQLQTNFTLPIAVAGGFMTKFAVENEAAMVRLRKVYGDLSMSEQQVSNETEALQRHFRALSETYGVHQKEVIEIGAAWAAAGSSGVALAKSVQETMRTMVLGEISAAEATEALIAIQAQYRLSTAELSDTINMLNLVENQTGTSMKDLIEGMERASGAAASAGIDIEHLVAGMAALVPAAGSAANAGNALKTIYTRLAAPTHDAIQLLEELHIKTKEQAWISASAADRLDILSDALGKASTSQQRMAARTLFGIYQISRADILIRALTDSTSYYNKALDELNKGPAHRLAVAQRELNTILESQPMQLKRLGVIYENIAADIGTQLVPAVIMAGEVIKDVLQGFNDLSPTMQKAAIAALLFLAVVGPLVRWAAGFVVLLGVLGKGLFGVLGAFSRLGGVIVAIVASPFKILSGAILGAIALFGKIGAAFAAFKASGVKAGAVVKMLLTRVGLMLLSWPAMLAVALVAGIAIFRDQIGQAFSAVGSAIGDNLSMFSGAVAPLVQLFHKAADGIVSAFYKLPQGIQSAMMAVINIVHQAVMAVYELFSYLNPFARHSPSLVENVTEGMAVVRDEFATITSIGDPINKAYADIEKFKRATAEFKGSLDTFKRAEDLKNLLKIAPGASDEFLALVRDLQKLEPVVDRLEAKMDKQQRVVDAWEAKLDKLNAKLDKQKDKLEDLQDVADEWANKLAEANDRLADFASTPLKGLGAMEDQIFANSQAQKALQLQMMELEDAVGPMDDLKNRMSQLAGEIEVLRGEQTSLRDAGAGSDILAVYDEQIHALEQQQSAINDTSSQYNELQDQLEALQRAGQKLDLQKSLNFDGLQRDIQKAADAITEMPFEEIMAGIQGAQADIALYSGKVDEANQRVKEQQQVVDGLQERYDAMKARYDAEKQALDEITAKYDRWRDAAEKVRAALDDVGQAAAEALEKGMKKKGGGGGSIDPAVQDFLDAAGGNFDIPLGTGKGPGREGGMGDQSSLIDDLTADLRDAQKKMADKLDVFKPLRDQWGKFKSWWATNVSPGLRAIWDDLKTGMGEIDWGAPFKDAEGQDTRLTTVFKNIGNGLKDFWALMGPEVTARFSLIFGKLKKAFDELAPVFVDLGRALGNLWKAVQPLVMLIGGILLFAIKVLASTITGVLGPAFDAIIFAIKAVIQFITGVINVFSGILLNDWGILWEGVKQIFQSVWSAIQAIWDASIGLLIGAIRGFVEGVIGFFQWLYDILVGNSIIPDMVNAIVDWFVKMPGRILNAIIGLGQKLWDWAKAAWDKVTDALGTAWSTTSTWVKGVPQKIVDLLAAGYELIKSAGSAIINKVKDGLVAAWNAVSTWIGEKVTWVVDKFSGIKDSLAGKFSGMFDGIKDAFRSAINTIIGWWNGLSLSFDIPDKIPGLPDSFTISTPDIGYLAKGGVAKSGQMYVVGEVGPEIFIPGTTGTVTSNADIAQLMSRATQDALSTLAGTGAVTMYRSASSGQLDTIAGAADRRIGAATAGSSTLAGRTVVNQHNEYHFHGDLSFPNIKSGEDAETFLTNLSDLAG
jgi:TP901 family phage tail tape measure protein